MFGEDNEIRQLKKRLSLAGCDMDVVKNWQRQLERMHKQYRVQCQRFDTARACLVEVDSYMKRLEQMLIGRDEWSKEDSRQLSDIRKALKKMKDSYIHEFVVSKEDKDFHLTYETILKLSDKYDGSFDKRIIFQSEAENILAMIREDLEKEKPDMLALTYFYLEGSDSKLMELPPKGRLEKVRKVYESEFVSPMKQQLDLAKDMTDAEFHALIQRICTE